MEFVMDKLENLKKILTHLKSLVIAFSGGVDSTFLAKVASDVLHDKIILCTAVSETYTDSELQKATDNANRFGAKHIIIETEELDNPNFASNPYNRCYYCKSELFSKLNKIKEEFGFNYVADGATLDDLADFRPGRQAAAECGVVSPLKDAGLKKSDIRYYSQKLGLNTWDAPALACLSSRIPYGTPISKDILTKIKLGEDIMRSQNFKIFRVRHHDNIVRIEVAKEEIEKLLNSEIREKITNELKKIGYIYITMDLDGYRTGSMNEEIINKTGKLFFK